MDQHTNLVSIDNNKLITPEIVEKNEDLDKIWDSVIKRAKEIEQEKRIQEFAEFVAHQRYHSELQQYKNFIIQAHNRFINLALSNNIQFYIHGNSNDICYRIGRYGDKYKLDKDRMLSQFGIYIQILDNTEQFIKNFRYYVANAQDFHYKRG